LISCFQSSEARNLGGFGRIPEPILCSGFFWAFERSRTTSPHLGKSSNRTAKHLRNCKAAFEDWQINPGLWSRTMLALTDCRVFGVQILRYVVWTWRPVSPSIW
jgi:hypothetical protein